MKASLAKNFHIQPSEIDKMVYWEYELFIEALNSIIKDENEQQQNEMDKHHVNEYMNMASPKNMERAMNPKMPDMPSMKMPSLGM